MRSSFSLAAAAAALTASITGCAPVEMRPAALTPEPRGGIGLSDRVLTAPVTGRSSAGIPRTLPQGTILRRAGSIPEGEVWRPQNRTLTAQGWNVHEGWVVLSGSAWTGFYLPVERAFSPLAEPVTLTTEERPR